MRNKLGGHCMICCLNSLVAEAGPGSPRCKSSEMRFSRMVAEQCLYHMEAHILCDLKFPDQSILRPQLLEVLVGG